MRYIDWFGDSSVVVLDLALACCAIETEAAIPRHATYLASPPPGARVVITISGTLSSPISSAVRDTIAAHPDAVVVAIGACACTGGPYWDSYAVTTGADQLVRIDKAIPGCPPHPKAIEAVINEVRHG